MNTLPWDTDDSVKRSCSLLLTCFIVSIILHLIFLVYFTIPNNTQKISVQETIPTLRIDLKTTATIKQTTPVKPQKKRAPKKAQKEKASKKNQVVTAKNTQESFSALEKIKPKSVNDSIIKPRQTANNPDKAIEKNNRKDNPVENKKEETIAVTDSEKAIEYKVLLENWLSRFKQYPPASKRKRQEGVIVVSFTINAEGRLLSHEIKQSSRYRLLNKAVIKMLKRANPMPAIPHALRGNKTAFRYTIPVEFSLNRL